MSAPLATPAMAPKRIRLAMVAGVCLILAVGVVLIIFCVTLYRDRHDSTPTVYHHADGHFSLNMIDGPPVSPADVVNHLKFFKERSWQSGPDGYFAGRGVCP